jgi:hypothetical protein
LAAEPLLITLADAGISPADLELPSEQEGLEPDKVDTENTGAEEV